jgi:hypothetical protein
MAWVIIALPNVGEPATADRLLEGLLERIRGSRWVGLSGSRLAEHRAQVEKVGLGRRTFGCLDAAPFGGKLAGCHAGGPAGILTDRVVSTV